MSVKDRIKSFEAISNNEEKTDDKGKNHGKKFLYPGKQVKPPAESKVIVPRTRSKPSILSDFEADLQEVWSVRKNIHHNNKSQYPVAGVTGSSSSLGVSKFNQSYSRHGAIPSLQNEAPLYGDQKSNMDNSKSINKRSPLQDHNTSEGTGRTWNLRPTGFTYSDTPKRPGHSPPNSDSPPMAKRKMNFKDGLNEGVRQSMNGTSGVSSLRQHFMKNKDISDHKMNYAQRMSQAHLKSVGMGDYTPRQSGYTKQELKDDKSTKWKRFEEHDDFSFD